MLKVFIIGSKELSCHILDAVESNGQTVVGVLSRDHEPGMRIWHTMGHRSLEALATSRNIPVHKDISVNSETLLKIVSESEADLILSCFWSELFRDSILNATRLGAYNFHTAYLPRHRGSRPIPWAIIKGDSYCGITLHRMRPGVDDGEIVDQVKVNITPKDTAGSVYDKVTEAGKELAYRSIEAFSSGTLKPIAQEESLATYQLRGEPYGGQINYFWASEQADKVKRALTFPPFKAWRKSPQAISSKQNVRLIFQDLSSENRMKTVSFDDFGPEIQAINGGDSSLRKRLRERLPKISGGGAHLKLSHNLNRYYPLLESLRQGGYAYVSSLDVPTSDWSNGVISQPFRYENGLLEIPVHLRNPKVSDVGNAVEYMLRFAREIKAPVYLHILVEEETPAETAKELTACISEQIQIEGVQLVTYEDVCKEFDTDYENISA